MRGYWNKPEATATSFTDGWLHSGDVAKLDDEGFIYIVDRAKDMVIRGGENVYSAEVEAAIFEHPSVSDAAVIGVPHEVLGEEVGAVVVLKPACELHGRRVASARGATDRRVQGAEPCVVHRGRASAQPGGEGAEARAPRAGPRDVSTGTSSSEPREGFTTKAVHRSAEGSGEVHQTPASMPIYQTSTWRFSTGDEFAEVLDGARPGYAYGRGYGNPTVDAFESVLASLEGTEAAFAFSSGMSAIHAVCVALAKSGDRIVASRELYGGTYSLFQTVLPRYGITVEEVDPHDLDAVRRSLPGAALFYCETIANPLCTVADLPVLGAACRDAGVPAVVDNTFASPYLCNPVDHGFDYVVHSVTKMIAGHSDLVAGAVCCSGAARSALRKLALDTGGAMPPFEAWLCMRGVETLEAPHGPHVLHCRRLGRDAHEET